MIKRTNFNNGTTADTEYVEFRAMNKTNLGEYALLDNTFSDGKPSNIFRHFYKLPAIALEAGDYVKVFTGNAEKANKCFTREENGVKVNVWYVSMGSKACIWNNSVKDKLEIIKYNTVKV
jgi:hypothetical protein